MRHPYTDNIHEPPAEGNFSVESGNTIKPPVIEDLVLMGYVGKRDQIATSYGMNRNTWKQTKRFCHFTELVIINVIIHRFCGGIMMHKKFKEQLMRDLIFLFMIRM
jgi:hypothetical protein